MPRLAFRAPFATLVLAPAIASATTVVIVDNCTPQATASGNWQSATAATDHYGTISEYAISGGGPNTMTYAPDLPATGRYVVEAWNSCYSPRADNVAHEVFHAGGVTPIQVNQDPSTGSCASWTALGEFDFDAGTGSGVVISDAGVVPGAVIGADAVRFTRLPAIVINHVDSDELRVYLVVTGAGGVTEVSMSWPLAAPCPDTGGACPATPLVIEGIVGSSVVALLPDVVTPGSYRFEVTDGVDTGSMDHTLVVGGPPLITEIALNGSSIEIVEGGTTHTLDLTPIEYGDEDGRDAVTNMGGRDMTNLRNVRIAAGFLSSDESTSFVSNGDTVNLVFTGLSPILADAQLEIGLQGDFDSASEFADFFIGSTLLGRHNGGPGTCNSNIPAEQWFPISSAVFNAALVDGSLTVRAETSSAVHVFCGNERISANLIYSEGGQLTVDGPVDVAGQLDVAGAVHVGGELRVDGALRAADVDISGRLTVRDEAGNSTEMNALLQRVQGLEPKAVFVTSTQFFSDFAASGGKSTGLWGADRHCNDAAAAGVVPVGEYVAFLSTTAIDARDRLPPNDVGYVLSDGTSIVASSKSDLLDGSIQTAINHYEFGQPLGPAPNGDFVWTGSNASGVRVGSTCGDWVGGAGEAAVIGNNTATDGRWARGNFVGPRGIAAHFAPRLYCFQR